MYQNREPRFYINVLWSGCVWHSGNVNKGVVQLYTGGNSGYAATQQNYPATGYLAGKFIDHTKDTSTAGDSTSTDVWDFIDWPIIRYAEICLLYTSVPPAPALMSRIAPILSSSRRNMLRSSSASMWAIVCA